MGYHPCQSTTTMPLIRPKLLIETARIVARLSEAERNCEALRRQRSPAYRHGRHVQILSALMAEADQVANHGSARLAGQTKASGSDALRLAM